MPGPTPTPEVSTWPLSKVDIHNARKGLRFAGSLKAWPLTLGAVGAFLIYPALTEDFKKNPFDLFGQEE